MRMQARMLKVLAGRALMIVALAAFVFQAAHGQSNYPKASAGAKTNPATAATADDANKSSTPEIANTLKAAAEAVGLARWSGVGGQRLPEVDVINTMEIWGSGTTYCAPLSSKAGEPWLAYKTEYHATLGYNPPAMRVELTRTSSDTPGKCGAAPQHTIQVVRDNYAWDESEIGAGLVPGKGTATPAMGAVKSRLLQLWILPYGVIKAALSAGDKTKVTTENGVTVITFPLGGQLSGVVVKATLDAQNEVVKVETRSENPSLDGMLTETEYSGYADHGEIATDVKSPAHIVQKLGGKLVLDIQVKKLDANNPYLVFPVPENVRNASTR